MAGRGKGKKNPKHTGYTAGSHTVAAAAQNGSTVFTRVCTQCSERSVAAAARPSARRVGHSRCTTERNWGQCPPSRLKMDRSSRPPAPL